MRVEDGRWQQRWEEAQRVVDQTVEALPDDVREHAERLGACFEDVPGAALHARGFGTGLLGLFSGRPLRAPAGNDRSEPVVTLFLDNLWRYAGEDWERYRREVRKTYLHELGHYLGLNEADLAQRRLR